MTKVAILSDSHDNIQHLEAVLAEVRASGAEVLLHCGDLCAPFMVNRLAQGFSGPIQIVFGNNDGDGRLLQTMAAKHAHVTLNGIYTELTVANRQIAMIHYPEPAQRIAQANQLDLVCYGHNHQKHYEQIGKSWLVNPGEILGMYGAVSWGLYDCAVHTYEERIVQVGK